MENTGIRKRKLTSQESEDTQHVPVSDLDVGLGVDYIIDNDKGSVVGALEPAGVIKNGDDVSITNQPTSELLNGTESRTNLRTQILRTFDDVEPCSKDLINTTSEASEQNINYCEINEEMCTVPTYLDIDSCTPHREGTMPLGVREVLDLDQNGCAVPELSFREVPETPTTRKKVQEIEKVLSQEPVNVNKLKKLAISEGGLIHDNIRKRAWSKLVGIDKIPPLKLLTDKELETNEEYNQVVLDVNRSLKRFPPGIPYEQRVVLQDQLTRLIMRVIIKHPHLKYYQGYHDVAVTVLLVVGEEAAFPIMEKLSTGHLKECMADTMDKTSHLLNYIYPLLRRMHSKLYDFMERSGCGTLFCLPWYLTWFGHNLNHYTDVVRLYDFFMSTEKLLPLYLAAAIVVHRRDEIFNVECDMPYVHSLLSNIPDDLPFEKLLKEALQLYKTYPPSSIEKEVDERTRLSKMQLRGANTTTVSHRRMPLRSLLQLMPRYSVFLATATLVVGLYAYIRTASALDPESLLPFR